WFLKSVLAKISAGQKWKRGLLFDIKQSKML
ncbi:unnamed protein product, partial [marine sediment metagenome]